MESKLLRPLSQAVALALAAGGAHAAAITVTDGGDAGTAGTCTLRQAIFSANTDSAQGTCAAGSGADTITFAAGLANSTIALQSGQLFVTSDVTISGSGQTVTAAANSRVLVSNAIATVSISDLTITGGNTAGAGGGIAIYGSNFTLDKVTISGNQANALAGGLFIRGGQLSLNQSTVSGNALTMGRGGGGIYAGGNASITITDATISGNSAAGGGAPRVAGGLLADNSSVTITNSTLANNSASGTSYGAGGLMSRVYGSAQTLDVYNTTITGNSGASSNVAAGGILVGAPVGTLVATITNSIIAGNTGTTADVSRFNNANVIAHSDLLGTALSATYAGNGNVFSDAPGLGALANNGGPTLTMLPQAGSPALGAGNAALVPSGVTTDQRGAGFPRVTNGVLDIGAVQATVAPIVPPTPTPALSRWAMLALAGLLGLFGLRKRRRVG